MPRVFRQSMPRCRQKHSQRPAHARRDFYILIRKDGKWFLAFLCMGVPGMKRAGCGRRPPGMTGTDEYAKIKKELEARQPPVWNTLLVGVVGIQVGCIKEQPGAGASTEKKGSKDALHWLSPALMRIPG
jgi:hypothetical protein